MRDREFAFGKNTAGDCACPAVTAGFNPDNDASIEPAEWYDEYLREHDHGDSGIVDEDTAYGAWWSILKELGERADRDPGRYEEAYRVGREIADELGWI
ncbi:hypothetical protein M1M38_gp091 [Halorubrum tailed virus 27]|uniref:Uncharacterized protein n=1 Tax=Halorubrum tailed virus 27 TaxID=2878008 RepID=A0AAE8XZ62_9CAUD|nr:hypothetical protein M1M38_gp091 [Halorubrum tailed virus 27]UBF22784.1 hypothetical protein HRTV-27_gp91 [Halorubrum tailed virus 27]